METKSPFRIVVWPLTILVSALLLLIIAEQAYKVRQVYGGNRPENTIAVSAEGKVKAVPDTAIVTLGVIAQGSDAKKVESDAVTKINQITDFVKGLGVKKEDITTSQSGISPRYEYKDGRNVINGYQSNQMVTVKVRGVDESAEVVGKIMAGAINNGANEVYGSNFIIDDPEGYRQEARKIAIAKAKERAEELASVAGIKLGKVVSVSESGGGYPIPMYGEAGISKGMAVAPTRDAVAPNIEPGTQEVVETMTLVFEVK